MVRAFTKANLYLSTKAVTNQNKPLHSSSTPISQLQNHHQPKPVSHCWAATPAVTLQIYLTKLLKNKNHQVISSWKTILDFTSIALALWFLQQECLVQGKSSKEFGMTFLKANFPMGRLRECFWKWN